MSPICSGRCQTGAPFRMNRTSLMQDKGWESAHRMIANRSQRCFFFFSAQRAFANSDKRLRSAAVIPPLAGFGADCLATGFFALGRALAASFRAAHLARRASAILFLKAGLTLRRPLAPACFTPDFFSGTSVFFAAVFSFFLAFFICGRLGFDDTRSTGSTLGFVFCAMSNPK